MANGINWIIVEKNILLMASTLGNGTAARRRPQKKHMKMTGTCVVTDQVLNADEKAWQYIKMRIKCHLSMCHIYCGI